MFHLLQTVMFSHQTVAVGGLVKTVMAGDLKVGDYVYTKHEHTGEWGSYQVTLANPATNIVSQTVIGGKTLKVSSNHRFLTESMGFVPLSELWVGAKVQTIDGIAEIESIEELGELQVIQIEVDQAHTYVIEDVVSHNRKEQII
jgi:intein/homing endonuclease